MKKSFLFLTLALALGASGVFADDDIRIVNGFNVAELSGEDANPSKRPFSITKIEQSGKNLILWISSSNIGEVSRLLNAGLLETQSALDDDTSSPPLSLWKQVTCTNTMGVQWTTKLRY